jgi:hypothetical protein
MSLAPPVNSPRFTASVRVRRGTEKYLPREATVSRERNASLSRTTPEWEKETDQKQFYVRGSVSVESGQVVVALSRF